jgi:hypothetical protein
VAASHLLRKLLFNNNLNARVGIGRFSTLLQVKYAWFHWLIKQIHLYQTMPFLTLLVSVLVSAIPQRTPALFLRPLSIKLTLNSIGCQRMVKSFES